MRNVPNTAFTIKLCSAADLYRNGCNSNEMALELSEKIFTYFICLASNPSYTSFPCGGPVLYVQVVMKELDHGIVAGHDVGDVLLKIPETSFERLA